MLHNTILPIESDGCKYERLEEILANEDKGSILALEFVSYTECESKCDNNKECMNFEYCPKRKMCRLYDAKIRNAQNLKQQQWFDCFANYATCEKGEMTSTNSIMNIIPYFYKMLFKLYFIIFLFSIFTNSREKL